MSERVYFVKRNLAIVIALFFSVCSYAIDWSDINWKSGQILGISSRSGLTPVIVQMGTLSQVDHLGIVSLESDGPWLYEFTNATGVQKIPISEVWLRSADAQKEVHFILGELSEPLTLKEWHQILNTLDSWILRKESYLPSNCLETVLRAFASFHKFFIRTTSAKPIIETLGQLPIIQIFKKTYPNINKIPIIASIFEGLHRSAGNLPDKPFWISEIAFVEEWIQNGDLSKFNHSLSDEYLKSLDSNDPKLKALSLANIISNRRHLLHDTFSCQSIF